MFSVRDASRIIGRKLAAAHAHTRGEDDASASLFASVRANAVRPRSATRYAFGEIDADEQC
jgi:hypothetical protein